jgi:hypothetical protein
LRIFLLKSFVEVLEEYRHPDFVVSSSGHPLELDFFYPEYNLAFEYQGQQHYRDIPKFNRYSDSLEQRKLRDLRKITVCREKGMKN